MALHRVRSHEAGSAERSRSTVHFIRPGLAHVLPKGYTRLVSRCPRRGLWTWLFNRIPPLRQDMSMRIEVNSPYRLRWKNSIRWSWPLASCSILTNWDLGRTFSTESYRALGAWAAT